MYKLFMALRYLRAHKIIYFAIVGVALGILAMVVVTSLTAIAAMALLPGAPYNPYLDLVPALPEPDRLLAVGLLAVPAVTASLSRVSHAPHHA